jgi:hypothetical protein
MVSIFEEVKIGCRGIEASNWVSNFSMCIRNSGYNFFSLGTRLCFGENIEIITINQRGQCTLYIQGRIEIVTVLNLITSHDKQ